MILGKHCVKWKVYLAKDVKMSVERVQEDVGSGEGSSYLAREYRA